MYQIFLAKERAHRQKVDVLINRWMKVVFHDIPSP